MQMTERSFGTLTVWPEVSDPAVKPTFNQDIPEHWPQWAKLSDGEFFEVLRLTLDDVRFLINGFDEQHPWLDKAEYEDWRYQKFCLTLHGYKWAERKHPNAKSDGVGLLNQITTRVLLIGGRSLTGGDLAIDAAERFGSVCSLSEIRATMFRLQRAHHFTSSGDANLITSYPELRDMARALEIMLKTDRKNFWDAPDDR